MEKICGNCLFYEVLHYEDIMFGDANCCRFPPTVLQDSPSRGSTRPRVFEHDWCGEWQPQFETIEHKPTDIKLDHLEFKGSNGILRNRIINHLKIANIFTVGDLIALKENDLNKIRCLGVNSISAIKSQLQELGLSLTVTE